MQHFLLILVVALSLAWGILFILWRKTLRTAKQLQSDNAALGKAVQEIRQKLSKTKDAENRLGVQLRQSQKMEALGTLAGGIAHDFNNILSAVIGYTELAMHDAEEGTPIYGSLEAVLGAAKRAAELVSQILTFSRRTEHESRPLLLAPILKEALKLLRGTLPSTIDIQQNISDTNDPVLADATQMHQIIMNLCTNAYHSMRTSGGMLSVDLSVTDIKPDDNHDQYPLPPGHYAKISVTDTGVGIPPEVLDRIFEPYFTTKKGRDGTGLGLSTVHGIVKLHGGAVTVTSEVGKGSTFNVLLPVCSPDFGDDDEEAAKNPIPQGNGECILIVDDEETITQMMEITLRHLGYKTVSFNSSVKALDAFESAPDRFRCVITDQTMPTMTGTGLSRRMLDIRPDLPILLCSGFSETINDTAAHEIGIREFLMKPMTTRVLAETVHRLIN